MEDTRNDAHGDPMFYAPTPVDSATLVVEPGRWRAARFTVRLAVNHSAGPLRIYGLVSPRPPTADEVRVWSRALTNTAPAGPGDLPWIEGMNADALARVCPSGSQCHAVELALSVAP